MPASNMARRTGASGDARLSAAEIKARLDLVEEADRLTTLEKRGGELWGLCPIHAERSPSFKVDPRKQTFHCFGCGAHGDVIDLLAAVRQIPLAEALRLLQDRTTTHAPIRRAGPPTSSRQIDKRRARRQARALEIWRDSIELPGDSEGARYLRERRRITAWDADRVRWHPECPWMGAVAPRIVVPVTGPGGTVSAIWRIVPAMTGKVPRAGLGPITAGAARLFDAPGPELGVAEGVESALAVHQRTGLATWAALCAGNMRGLMVPERFRVVRIFADVEPSGVGLRAAQELAARLRGEGRRTSVYVCEDGGDPNDALMAREAS